MQLTSEGAGHVLLVDGDQLTASIAFMLKLKPQFHLEDVLRDWARMDDDLWSRLTVPAYGWTFWQRRRIPPRAPKSRASLLPNCAPSGKSAMRLWSWTCPTCGPPPIAAFAALADRLLLVTTSELAALQAPAEGCAISIPEPPTATNCGSFSTACTPAMGLQRDDVKTALNMQPFAVPENDYEVLQAAVLEGRPAPAASRYGASVRSLCRQLTQKAAQPKKNESWLSGLLHRKPLMSR